jgi:hypothetical protein
VRIIVLCVRVSDLIAGTHALGMTATISRVGCARDPRTIRRTEIAVQRNKDSFERELDHPNFTSVKRSER